MNKFAYCCERYLRTRSKARISFGPKRIMTDNRVNRSVRSAWSVVATGVEAEKKIPSVLALLFISIPASTMN